MDDPKRTPDDWFDRKERRAKGMFIDMIEELRLQKVDAGVDPTEAYREAIKELPIHHAALD